MPPEAALADPTVEQPGFGLRMRTERDAGDGALVRTTWIDATDEGEPAVEHHAAVDLDAGHGIVERLRIVDGDPSSAMVTVEHRTVCRRGDWEARVVLRARLWSEAGATRLAADLEAQEHGGKILERRWDTSVPRPGTRRKEGAS
jgi:hypothetical protein